MRVLVTWGSKRGGTEGIARILGETLEGYGFEVVMASAERAPKPDSFGAVIVGGALYANRWPGRVRRYVHRNVAALRRVPVWFFSSGPLDASADAQEIPPSNQVAALAERAGALGHHTFGGRLEPDVKGFPAEAMAKANSGDWRNPAVIRGWAAQLASEILTAKPGQAVDHPAYALPRSLLHGLAGWAACALLMYVLLNLVGLTPALVLHAVAAPLIFIGVAHHYFHARGAREPLSTALTWTTLVAALDLLFIAALLERSLAMFTSLSGTWLPLAMIFLATWSTGELMSTLPWSKGQEPKPSHPGRPLPQS